MDFSKAYDRNEFLDFLSHFLPDDFQLKETSLDFESTYTRKVTKLGEVESLEAIVLEVQHSGKEDPRVGLSKEAFRILAGEWAQRALVIFVPQDNAANYRFSLIEVTLEGDKKTAKVYRRYSNPRRYSYQLGEGIACYTPNKYLNEKDQVVNKEDLLSRFSVEVLTKEFYQELSDWYAWAVKIVRFPNKLNDPTDDDKFNAENTIRLITRLIFVWFLKQKNLIPNELFDEVYIRENLIANFSPEYNPSLFYNAGESTFYKAILQNLFFAMLNSPITVNGNRSQSERHFCNKSEDDGNSKLMHYESLFSNPHHFIELANKQVPFLNGGLFDCLDDIENGNYTDGFSNKQEVQKTLFVPDYLFFAKELIVDLSHWYDDKKKNKVKVRGLLHILKCYNFTIEENTPFDQEVSLDPELLGKVFENLLASYNSETQTTARKQTGSFYTPREIVQYMVDESLIGHLKRTVGEELEPQYRQLIQYSDDEVKLSTEQRKKIMHSLYNCKIPDPACGSGAFPVGMLQQMVHILNRIDPGNTMWREMMMQKAIDETSDAYRNSSDEERKALIKDIERSFDESINRPDYARKLYLIENCIYGVDIQPIAIQISKLRFFISLVVDQKTNTDPTDNFGIRPLPNLEAKFVAANTLIGLDKKDTILFDRTEIKAKENELKIAKHKIFGAKTINTKRKYKNIVNCLRQEIADMLYANGAVGNDEARQLASWDMFDQNASSPFFDPEWMFGIKDGFDIVIGNPPYIDIKALPKNDVKLYFNLYNTTENRINLYSIFIERGTNLLSHNGILCYINPNSMLVNESYYKLRQYIIDYVDKIIKLPDAVFSSATVETIILLLRKNNNNVNIKGAFFKKNCKIDFSKLSFNTFNRDSWKLDPDIRFNIFTPENVTSILKKIRKGSQNLENYVLMSLGITPYDKYKGHSEDLIKKRAFHSKVPIDKTYVPLISGKNIHHYYISNEIVEYLKYGDWLGAPREKKFFESPKIIVRQILEGNSQRIVAAYSDKPRYFTQIGFSIIEKQSDTDLLKYLVCLLNSTLISFYHRNVFLDLEKVVFQKILIANAKKLPIKIPTDISIFIKIFNNKEYNDVNRIDLLIYKIYNLTYDEVLIVDPQTPITREEYEKE